MASYSRTDGADAVNTSVCVPGYPPLLLSQRIHEKFKLPRDEQREVPNKASGIQAERPPTMWMGILYRSIRLCSPDFDPSAVDIVTEKLVLDKLLRFCGSPGNRRDEKCAVVVAGTMVQRRLNSRQPSPSGGLLADHRGITRRSSLAIDTIGVKSDPPSTHLACHHAARKKCRCSGDPAPAHD